MYKAASFFSGIGGLDLAFAWSGFDIVYQCEIDDYCRQVLKKWKPVYWPNARIGKDIKDVKATDVGKVGAPHRRERWFCVAYDVRSRHHKSSTTDKVTRHKKRHIKTRSRQRSNVTGTAIADGKALGNTQSERQQKRGASYAAKAQRIAKRREAMGNAQRLRLERATKQGKQTNRPDNRKRPSRTTQSRLGRRVNGISSRVHRHRGISSTDHHAQRWPTRPNEEQHGFEPGRVTERKEHRVDRIKALGNAVVPQQSLPIVMAVKEILRGE